MASKDKKKTFEIDKEDPRDVQSDDVMVCWVDGNIRDDSTTSRQMLDRLNEIIPNVQTYQDVDAACTFINTLDSIRLFVITSGALVRGLAENIHSRKEVINIYVFCRTPLLHEELKKIYPKLKLISKSIEPICNHIREFLNPPSTPSTPGSGPFQSTVHLEQLDSSFRSTLLFKHAILKIYYDDESLTALVQFCKKKYKDQSDHLEMIEKFRTNYLPSKAVQCFTCNSFLQSMLEGALTKCLAETLMKMGFFINDLHNQIITIHADQLNQKSDKPFTVYRAQKYSIEAFQQLQQNRTKPIAFNYFLLTTKNRDVAKTMARKNLEIPNMISVLFTIQIDPRNNSIAWISDDDTVLFDMQTVFRFGRFSTNKRDDRFYELDLTLVKVDEEEIRTWIEPFDRKLTKMTQWKTVGDFFFDSKEFKTAAAIYQVLLAQSTSPHDQGQYVYLLGIVYEGLGKFKDAVQKYEEALKIDETLYSPQDPHLAAARHNVGSLYYEIDEYSKALPFLIKALETWRASYSIIHPEIRIILRKIDRIHEKLKSN